MAITLTGTGITFPVGGTQEKAASGFALGYGQIWYNVTANRALFPETYTNSTGRPIQVFIRMAGSTSNALVFRVDGVDISVTGHNGGSGTSCVSCIVPTGSTYSISNASWPLGLWFELR
jgi:hypothetical protein